VKTTMQNGGTAIMGSAVASGENRAEKAAIAAISSPLLDGLSIAGARNVLVNITAGRSLGIREATTAVRIIQQEAGEDVEVIFGTVIDDNMGDDLRVTVIATGFDREQRPETMGRRRTVPLEPEDPYINYKGEENLKRLDTPAFERRVIPGTTPAEGERLGNIRRLQADELRERGERIRKDNPDTPAFLRKMLD